MLRFVNVLVLGCVVTGNVWCVLVQENFKDYTGITDKVCPIADVLFSQSVSSLVSCTFRCKNEPTCLGIFYNDDTGLCTGCIGNYDDVNVLDDSMGTVYFKKVKCYEPITEGPPNVQFQPVTGYSDPGTTFKYKCKPCSSYPRNGQDTFTCSIHGTWTGTFDCISGPDEMVLKNGQPVPEGSIGCNGQCGPSIAGGLFLLGGTGNCWCDLVCCDYEDCCFDVPYCG